MPYADAASFRCAPRARGVSMDLCLGAGQHRHGSNLNSAVAGGPFSGGARWPKLNRGNIAIASPVHPLRMNRAAGHHLAIYLTALCTHPSQDLISPHHRRRRATIERRYAVSITARRILVSGLDAAFRPPTRRIGTRPDVSPQRSAWGHLRGVEAILITPPSMRCRLDAGPWPGCAGLRRPCA